MLRSTRIWIAGLLVLALAACSQAPDTPEAVDAQEASAALEAVKEAAGLAPLAEALASGKPIELKERGVRVEILGQARMTEVKGIEPPRIVDDGSRPGDPEEEKGEPTFAGGAMVVFSTESGLEHVVSIDPDLQARLFALHEEFGVPVSSDRADEAAEEEEGLGRQAITDGVDTRVLRANPAGHSAWRRIVRLGVGCTGTMVGPRVVLTAAHCLMDRGSNTYFSQSVTPARDGAILPFGSHWVGPGVSGTFLWVPQEWRNGSVCNSYSIECRRYDYGYVVLSEDVGNDTGWMGVTPISVWTLDDRNLYNRGYAGCGFSNSPSGCQFARLYGDTIPCDIGDYRHLTNGWYQIVHHSCDTNGGHSGSAVYSYLDGHPNMALVHHSWNSSKPWDAHLRNVGRRVDSGVRNDVNFLNAVF